jgi:predicted transcriptional regulator
MSEPTDQNDPQKLSSPSTFDLMSMPAPERRVIRIMLRKPVASYPDLCKIIDALPDHKRITRTELDKALAGLCEKGWLSREEVNDVYVYKVNLGTKTGSDVSRAGPSQKEKKERPRRGPSMSDLWDSVDSTSDTDYRKKHKDAEG